MAYFPMFVNLEQQDVLVAGGGKTAARKTKTLLSFGAVVTLVAPEISPCLSELADAYPNQLRRLNREWSPSDLKTRPYRLAVAATDSKAANARMAQQCAALGIPVNVADSPSLCTFYFPAVARRGNVVCGVSSSGKSPVVAQYVRDAAVSALPPDIDAVNEKMGQYRVLLQTEVDNPEERRMILRDIAACFLSGDQSAADGTPSAEERAEQILRDHLNSPIKKQEN